MSLLKLLAIGRQKVWSFDVVILHLWHYRTHWKLTKCSCSDVSFELIQKTQLGIVSTGPIYYM